MLKEEILIDSLRKIEQAIDRIIKNSACIDSYHYPIALADADMTGYHYYYNTPSGMERLESTCMLLIAIGEGLKGIDKITDKQLLVRYPEIDWKGAMGIRDIIAHHYFDLDGEIVYSVVKTKLPDMLITIRGILKEIKY